jgi:hypothetical protein
MESFKSEITFRTHGVVVEVVDDEIYCFKHNDKLCSLEKFDDYDMMIEWVLEPFPSLVYGLVIENDK